MHRKENDIDPAILFVIQYNQAWVLSVHLDEHHHWPN